MTEGRKGGDAYACEWEKSKASREEYESEEGGGGGEYVMQMKEEEGVDSGSGVRFGFASE